MSSLVQIFERIGRFMKTRLEVRAMRNTHSQITIPFSHHSVDQCVTEILFSISHVHKRLYVN
jgi:hypothetical protein